MWECLVLIGTGMIALQPLQVKRAMCADKCQVVATSNPVPLTSVTGLADRCFFVCFGQTLKTAM